MSRAYQIPTRHAEFGSHPDSPPRSIFTAHHELGLDLEPRKISMKRLIVDSAKRIPAENRPSLGIHRDHTLNRPAADGAEANLVAGKHDAVLPRTIVAFGFVIRPFERAHFAGICA